MQTNGSLTCVVASPVVPERVGRVSFTFQAFHKNTPFPQKASTGFQFGAFSPSHNLHEVWTKNDVHPPEMVPQHIYILGVFEKVNILRREQSLGPWILP